MLRGDKAREKLVKKNILSQERSKIMENTFKVIVCGSREFKNQELMEKKLDYLLVNKISTSRVIILSGCARGADLCGERYAIEKWLDIERFPAQWEQYGKSAGFKRNADMIEKADAVVAFWDGKSRGTQHMIELARKRNVPIRIIKY